ncbi:MAG: protein kinase [Acidobacteriota bacterium]
MNMRCQCGTEFDATVANCPQCGARRVAPRANAAKEGELIPGIVVFDKYEVIRLIGRGGMGQVYLARDLKLERNIALKTLARDFSRDEESKARFMREARMASALNHPNILTVYEVGTIGDTLFIATELVEGQTLRQLTRARRLSLRECLEIAVQAAQGLVAAHEAGIVHRDLKLENFILRHDGYLKILDFGLAKLTNTIELSEHNKEFQTQVGTIVGTPNYMSPEQAKGTQIDVRSDIFSFGTVLYELLTGRIAFEGDSDMQILFHVAYQEPEPISDTIPLRVREIVKRAMKKAPDARYQTMRALLDDLMAARDEQYATGPLIASRDRNTGSQRLTVSRPREQLTNIQDAFNSAQFILSGSPDYDRYIGRDNEMETLKTEFRRGSEGKARPMLIVGEPGCGKTQMLIRFQQWVVEQGAIAATGNFFDYGGNLAPAYHVFLSLFISALGIRDTESTLGQEAEVWRRISISVREQLAMELPSGVFEHSADHDDEAQKWQTFEAVRKLLLRLSEERPFVLLFDNLHWADSLSFDLIGYLLRNLSTAPVIMIATANDENVNKSGHPLRDWLFAQSRYRNFEQIQLKPFGIVETRQMLEAIFHRIEIAEREVTRLCELTSGNPYYLTEVVRLLVHSGKIAQGEGWWRCEPLEAVELPANIGITVQYKLEQCSEKLRDLLTQAAVIGDSFRFETLAALTEKDEEELEKLLTMATKAFLIREERNSHLDDYRFYNSVIRCALYEGLSKRQRRRLHSRVAEAILEVYRNKRPRVYGVLTYHYHAAGEWPQAFEYGIKAVEQAWERDSWSDVDRYAQWTEEAVAAMEENPSDYAPLDRQVVAQLKIRHAAALLRLGDKIDQAAKLATTVLEIGEAIQEYKLIARAKDQLCEIYWFQGRFNDALKAADEGLAVAGMAGDEHTERLLHYHRGWAGWRLAPFAEALVNLGRACELSEASKDMKLLAHARIFYGSVLHCQGKWRDGGRRIRSGLELTRQIGDRRGESVAHSLLVLVAYYERQHKELMDLYEAGIQLARTVAWRIGEAYFHLLLGFDYLSPTNLDINQAWNFLQRGLTICQETGEKGFQLLAARGLAKVASLMGEHDQAISRLRETTAIWQRMGELFEQCSTLCFLGQTEEAAGKTEEALNSFQTCQELSGQLPFPLWQWQALFGQARCLRLLNENAAARVKLQEACAIIERLRGEFDSQHKAANFIQETQAVYDALAQL